MLRRDRDEGRTGADKAGQTRQSTEGLTEERLPQGGAKMDLQGRFQQENAPVAPTPAAPKVQNGGRVAIIDPQTGRLVTDDAAALTTRRGSLDPAEQNFERQLQGVVQQSLDVSGLREQRLQSGAVKLDLGGRFQSPLVARITPEGDIDIRHGSPTGN